MVVFELPADVDDAEVTEYRFRLPTAIINVTIDETTKAAFVQAVVEAANRIDWQELYDFFIPKLQGFDPNQELNLVVTSGEKDMAVLWHLFPRGDADFVFATDSARATPFGSTFLDSVDDDGFWACVRKMKARQPGMGAGQDYFVCEVQWDMEPLSYEQLCVCQRRLV
jgi:hypothetical protein